MQIVISLHIADNVNHFLITFSVLCLNESVCIILSLIPLTDDHLEALWVVLYEGLSLHRLGEEGFGDQRKANAPQHLHHVLLSVTHIVLQPAHCCIINLNPNATTKHVGTNWFLKALCMFYFTNILGTNCFATSPKRLYTTSVPGPQHGQ